MNASTVTKNYANKEGFKTLLWIIAGVFALMFSVQLIKLAKGFIRMITGKASEEELNAKKDSQTNQVDALVKSSGYSPSSLPHPINFYEQLADSCENWMQGWGTQTVPMYAALKDLDANELKAVYLKFGSRINEDFSNDAGNLFTWFGWEIGNYSPFDFGALSRMQALWKKTGLPITF